MKKLITLLLIIPFVFACSDDENEPSQDYTSFTFEHHEPAILKNCIAAYLNKDNHFIKIVELGDLGQNTISKEITLNNKISEIYLFTIDTRLDAVFTLTQNKKNVIIIDKYTKGIPISESDKTDPTKYPQ